MGFFYLSTNIIRHSVFGQEEGKDNDYHIIALPFGFKLQPCKYATSKMCNKYFDIVL